MSIDVLRLSAMTQPELDEVYRAHQAGEIPVGVGDGTVLLVRRRPPPRFAATLTRRLGWRGKVFDEATGTLRNRFTPFGVLAITAKVYLGPSRLDGQETVVLDYSRTSVVARQVWDEIREVAPGVYLGFAWLGERRVASFALTFAPR